MPSKQRAPTFKTQAKQPLLKTKKATDLRVKVAHNRVCLEASPTAAAFRRRFHRLPDSALPVRKRDFRILKAVLRTLLKNSCVNITCQQSELCDWCQPIFEQQVQLILISLIPRPRTPRAPTRTFNFTLESSEHFGACQRCDSPIPEAETQDKNGVRFEDALHTALTPGEYRRLMARPPDDILEFLQNSPFPPRYEPTGVRIFQRPQKRLSKEDIARHERYAHSGKSRFRDFDDEPTNGPEEPLYNPPNLCERCDCDLAPSKTIAKPTPLKASAAPFEPAENHFTVEELVNPQPAVDDTVDNTVDAVPTVSAVDTLQPAMDPTSSMSAPTVTIIPVAPAQPNMVHAPNVIPVHINQPPAPMMRMPAIFNPLEEPLPPGCDSFQLHPMFGPEPVPPIRTVHQGQPICETQSQAPLPPPAQPVPPMLPPNVQPAPPLPMPPQRTLHQGQPDCPPQQHLPPPVEQPMPQAPVPLLPPMQPGPQSQPGPWNVRPFISQTVDSCELPAPFPKPMNRPARPPHPHFRPNMPLRGQFRASGRGGLRGSSRGRPFRQLGRPPLTQPIRGHYGRGPPAQLNARLAAMRPPPRLIASRPSEEPYGAPPPKKSMLQAPAPASHLPRQPVPATPSSSHHAPSSTAPAPPSSATRHPGDGDHEPPPAPPAPTPAPTPATPVSPDSAPAPKPAPAQVAPPPKEVSSTPSQPAGAASPFKEPSLPVNYKIPKKKPKATPASSSAKTTSDHPSSSRSASPSAKVKREKSPKVNNSLRRPKPRPDKAIYTPPASASAAKVPTQAAPTPMDTSPASAESSDTLQVITQLIQEAEIEDKSTPAPTGPKPNTTPAPT